MRRIGASFFDRNRISGSKASRDGKKNIALKMHAKARRLLRKIFRKLATGSGHENVTSVFWKKPLPPFQAQRRKRRHAETILLDVTFSCPHLHLSPFRDLSGGRGFECKNSTKIDVTFSCPPPVVDLP